MGQRDKGINLVEWIRMTKDKDNIPIQCNFCGYRWQYSGELAKATCPSCGNKVKVEENRMDNLE